MQLYHSKGAQFKNSKIQIILYNHEGAGSEEQKCYLKIEISNFVKAGGGGTH